MTTSYAVLRALPPEAYLDPAGFRTGDDHLHGANGYPAQQYRQGRSVSAEAEEIHITAAGTWGARLPAGGYLTAAEGIGYHACTADLLRGFLDGPAPILVWRDGQPDPAEIKPRTGPRS
jgi:hypothetical protein